MPDAAELEAHRKQDTSRQTALARERSREPMNPYLGIRTTRALLGEYLKVSASPKHGTCPHSELCMSYQISGRIPVVL